MSNGPLSGIKIIELAGIGPGPFCAFMLADMGADIIKIDRADRVRGGDPATPPADVLMRGRRSIGRDVQILAAGHLFGIHVRRAWHGPDHLGRLSRKRLECGEPACIARLLAESFDAAENDERIATRVVP